jgi:glutathione S-transferase
MYQLYYFPGNANLVPHILLEEIGAPYRLVPVDRANNAHKSPEYLRLNPAGRIPVLLDGDLVLFETAAICLHLVDSHPDAGLAPAPGTSERAEFYKWLVYLTNTVQTELITYFYPHRMTDDESAAAQVKQHAEAHLSGEGGMLDILEAQLAKSGGPWVLGAHYTAVDPYLMVMARWTRGMANPARSRKHLGRFLEAMAARPAVQRAFEQEGLKPPLY